MIEQARRVWLAGRSHELNVQAGFWLDLEPRAAGSLVLRLSGQTLYRVLINGELVHAGPVRAGHGWHRVDQVELLPHLRPGNNRLAIEVGGYYVASYYSLKQPSFLQAELSRDGVIIAATGVASEFRGVALAQRIQQVPRYSVQRCFAEAYHYDEPWQLDWAQPGQSLPEAALAEVASDWQLLPRLLRYLTYDWLLPVSARRSPFNRQPSEPSGPDTPPSERFSDHRIEVWPLADFEALQIPPAAALDSSPLETTLAAGELLLVDFSRNLNGFIQLEGELGTAGADLLLAWDEKLVNGRLDLGPFPNQNALPIRVASGSPRLSFTSFESYGMRYLLLAVQRGKLHLHRLGLREYACPQPIRSVLQSGDPDLDQIFAAAVATFRQNTVDVFMDCPTRERAGWLCDSYFTAQAAIWLTGSAQEEDVFLENYLLAREFPGLPPGMLPMCYPAEHPGGNYIPQWALWLVVQLEGYFQRSSRYGLAEFSQLCDDLLAFFAPFMNDDGLLESLPRWNFIEWSQANRWVQDVHYPTNMLYSHVLRLIGTWYHKPALIAQADAMRETIIEQAFEGDFFRDHACRQADGSLRPKWHISEVCQYFAFFFGIAEPADARFAALAERLVRDFGPRRRHSQAWPEVAMANAFIGNYLRLELLLRWGYYRQLRREVHGYFLDMAQRTGTLWENDQATTSLQPWLCLLCRGGVAA